MPSRTSGITEGHLQADRIRRELGRELRLARIGAGLSLEAAGRAAGMSRAQLTRIEHGEIAGLSIDQSCRAAAALGLRVTVRAFPSGDPVRDAGQLRLLERFRQRLPVEAGWQTEVPLPIPGDQRAWDATVTLGARRAGCEAETHLDDIQALERRLALKLRDGGADVLIVVAADTAHNRAVLAASREHLRLLLPLDGRTVLESLRLGRLPEQNGLVVL